MPNKLQIRRYFSDFTGYLARERLLLAVVLACTLQWFYIISVWTGGMRWAIINRMLFPFFPIFPLFPLDILLVAWMEFLCRTHSAEVGAASYRASKLIAQGCTASVLVATVVSFGEHVFRLL